MFGNWDVYFTLWLLRNFLGAKNRELCLSKKLNNT